MRGITHEQLLLLLSIVLIFLPYGVRKIKIARWRNSFALNQHEPAYQQLFADVNGFALSRAERIKQDALEYVYGEIEFTAYIALLSLDKPMRETVFYDLGSGVGKAVIACAMVFPVKKCIGIELFQSLHETARDLQQQLVSNPQYHTQANTIQFIQANYLTFDFSDATYIFINATALFGDAWIVLSRRIEDTPSCITVISTSKALKSKAFKTLRQVNVQMSWGVVSAYIQTRLA